MKRPISHLRTVLLTVATISLAACPTGPDMADDGGATEEADGGIDTVDAGPIREVLEDPEGVPGGATAVLNLGEIEAVGVGRFVTSKGCAMCHSNNDQATAMRDSEDKEIAPFNLWQGTMMANASRDPLWRAVVSAEIARHPTMKKEIEAECIRCHAPMASVHANDNNDVVDMDWVTASTDSAEAQTALDGVSCTVCHQTKSDNFGTEESFNGGFELNTERRIWGPHLNPATGPMQNHVNYTPTYGPHVLQSELCATCHTLDTHPLDENSAPVNGTVFSEQATYQEWKLSVFASEDVSQARSCQSCHMPTESERGVEIETRIARSPPGGDFLINERKPFGRHLFVGANTLIPTILKNERATLNPQATDEAFDAVVAYAEKRLRKETVDLFVDDVTFDDGRVSFKATVKTHVGHKLPTGFPARRVWMRATVKDASGNVLFENGAFNDDGRMIDAKGAVLNEEKAHAPTMPHFDTITADYQVQIYEQVMADKDGNPTFAVLAAASKFKDNRIFPIGATPSAAVDARTFATGVDDDADFTAGQDTVHYDVAVDGIPASVTVTLYYQGVSTRFARELFQIDTPEVKAFRTMYERTENLPVDMKTVSVEF